MHGGLGRHHRNSGGGYNDPPQGGRHDTKPPPQQQLPHDHKGDRKRGGNRHTDQLRQMEGVGKGRNRTSQRGLGGNTKRRRKPKPRPREKDTMATDASRQTPLQARRKDGRVTSKRSPRGQTQRTGESQQRARQRACRRITRSRDGIK